MLLTEFNYQKIMQMCNGRPDIALEKMQKSFSLYWRNRHNHIARKRVKSVIQIMRTLKLRISKNQKNPYWRKYD